MLDKAEELNGERIFYYCYYLSTIPFFSSLGFALQSLLPLYSRCQHASESAYAWYALDFFFSLSFLIFRLAFAPHMYMYTCVCVGGCRF